ncbi:MAG: hypothetical protein IJO22_08580 [Oscillospiraceae bacterium]|nr:hypothetical protein [Oscillospiraceae bacterium]
MIKPAKGTSVYPFTFIQEDDSHQLLFSFHKQSAQLALYFIMDGESDPELLKEALNIEIERNDCLRLRFFKKWFKYYQFFLPEYKIEDLPLVDFRGKTEKDMEEYFKSDAGKALRYLDGEVSRFRMFYTPDGRLGLYICVMHLAMDIAAILHFFRDLAFVYAALKNNTELPKPLSSFEDGLKRDFEIFNNKAKFEKNDKFFREYFAENGRDFYAGVDGMREIKRARKKKHNPNISYIAALDPFHDASLTEKHHIEGFLAEKMNDFCKERRVSVQSLLLLGLRTHLSKINEGTDDVSIMLTINRRNTLADMNSGGSRALALPSRTVISKETPFGEALGIVNNDQLRIFKHCDYPSSNFAKVQAKVQHRPLGTMTTSMLFTYFPKELLVLPEGMNCEFGGVSTGYFVFRQYSMFVPSFRDGGYDCYYEHQTYRINKEEVANMHNNMVKVIEMGIENPELTLGEILSAI